MSKQQQGTSLIVQNRRARHDYAIEDRYEAGIVLSGTEVKSLREGRASLAESFVSIDRRGEIWLEGANIPEYLNGTWNNHAPKRKRKLLLHAAQIAKLSRGIEAKGYTIVPLSLYFKDGRVKAEIALARGKKEYDKRQALREEQDKREALRIMRRTAQWAVRRCRRGQIRPPLSVRLHMARYTGVLCVESLDM